MRVDAEGSLVDPASICIRPRSGSKLRTREHERQALVAAAGADE